MQETGMLNRQLLPQLFGEIRHKWMQQAQRLLQDRNQTRPRSAALRRFHLRGHSGFGKLDVPIAEVVPEKVIERLDHAMKVISAELIVNLPSSLVKPR